MRSGLGVEHEVIWRPEARDDLYTIYDWIAGQADPDTAYACTSRIEHFVQRLSHFPNRGSQRFNLAAGLRSVTFERRIIITYRVDNGEVVVLRLIGGARQIERLFGNDT